MSNCVSADQRLVRLAVKDDLLQGVPGIGPVTPCALVGERAGVGPT